MLMTPDEAFEGLVELLRARQSRPIDRAACAEPGPLNAAYHVLEEQRMAGTAIGAALTDEVFYTTWLERMGPISWPGRVNIFDPYRQGYDRAYKDGDG
jgi:hypothetical protein